MVPRTHIGVQAVFGTLIFWLWCSAAWTQPPMAVAGKDGKVDRLYQEAIDRYLGLTRTIDGTERWYCSAGPRK